MQKSFFQTCLIFSLLVLFSCTSGEKKTITLNLEKGKTYTLSTKTEQTTTQTIMGFNNEMKMEIDGDIDYTVMDINADSTFSIDSKFGEMKMKMDAAMFKFNSEENSGINKTLHDALGLIKGLSIRMKISKDGKLKSMEGADSLIYKMSQSLANEDSTKTKSVNDVWSKYFSKNSLGGNFEGNFGFFPSKAVGQGDTWESEMENATVFPIKIKSKYKLKELTADYAIIKGESKITTSDNPTLEVSGIKMKYQMKGDQENTTKIDLKTGWIIEAEITAHISGEVSMDMSQAASKPGMNFSIPMKMESKTTIKGKVK